LCIKFNIFDIMISKKELNVTCSHCNSEDFRKNGFVRGIQRYYCKQCKRSFTTKPKKISSEVKAFAVMLYLNNMGIRKVAKVVNVSPPAVLRWLRNAHRRLQKELKPFEKGELDIIEMDEIYTFIKKTKQNCRMDCLFSKAKVCCCV